MHGQHGAAGTLVCACWPFLVVLETPAHRLVNGSSQVLRVLRSKYPILRCPVPALAPVPATGPGFLYHEIPWSKPPSCGTSTHALMDLTTRPPPPLLGHDNSPARESPPSCKACMAWQVQGKITQCVAGPSRTQLLGLRHAYRDSFCWRRCGTTPGILLTTTSLACWSQCLAWFHSSSTSCHFLLHLLCTSLTVQVAESPRPQSSPAKPLAIPRFLVTIRQHHRPCFTPLQLALSPLQLEASSSTRLVESRRLQGLLLKSARRADCFGW
ncbi:hypothetical protein BGZ61DRAFT_27859 [Ilyonectria robusta]|uniref:uncharacterized protein n=1 Tax=Ilyonectria robusta TaxID=1079257 RepID=UPI001E8E5ED0|nr:uncharacterized protein BGZ61DRAFT_27859 [Ilyonectria robusta]KAH8738095.1 hypothetical protein BGZ61DRAFT_27859 [Ilyonectria robusta]